MNWVSRSSAICASVDQTVRSVGMLPSATTATGVEDGRPAATRRAAMAGRFCTAMSSTTVPRIRATASHSTSEPGWSGGRWPLITVNSCATPRWVTGMPTSPGTEMELERPGTTVTGTPASSHAWISSNPRPKTKLSPPLKRTTRLPARARSTMTRLISSCVAERPRGSLATSMTSTSEDSSPSSSRGASRSATTTSASASALRAATVTRSGSPGPPPTSTTPGVRSGTCAGRAPSRSPSMIWSRSAAERRGSRLLTTATVTPSWRPTAGVQAVAWVASSARTQKIRRSSAASVTAALTSATSVAAMTYHASSQSAATKGRRCQVISPALAKASMAGVASGETTSTTAPAVISAGTRRCAT